MEQPAGMLFLCTHVNHAYLNPSHHCSHLQGVQKIRQMAPPGQGPGASGARHRLWSHVGRGTCSERPGVDGGGRGSLKPKARAGQSQGTSQGQAPKHVRGEDPYGERPMAGWMVVKIMVVSPDPLCELAERVWSTAGCRAKAGGLELPGRSPSLGPKKPHLLARQAPSQKV